MKRFTKHLTRIALLVIAAMLPQMASATFEVGGIAYNINSNGTSVTVTSGGNYAGAVNIPSSVTYNGTTYSVTEIGDYAFQYCRGLTSVTISNSVTSIGSYAFHGCTGLTSVTIPNSVTEIGSCAFSYCHNLTSITIPNSVTEIGWCAFFNCSDLKVINSEIEYPNLVSLGNNVFNGVDKNNCILLVPNESSNIYSQTNQWQDFSNILEKIDAFIVDGLCYKKNDDSLSVTVIACSTSGNIVIPSIITINGNNYSVTSIGSSAFYKCTGLTSVTIPNSVTEIGTSAFYGCTGLTSVTLNSDSIASQSYSSSSNISNIFGSQVKNYIIGDNVNSIGTYAFYGCTGLTSVNIGNSVTEIGDQAFNGCWELTSVNIPSSVTEIGDQAFNGCARLTSVNINNLAAWCDIDFGGYYANPLYYAHNLYLNDSQVTNLDIPNSVTAIKNYAFYNCSGLTSATIPNSVTEIGTSAFYGCSGLTSVTIPSSVTTIDEYAFYGCSGLTSVTIPNSVTSIGNSAFNGCTGLTSMVVESGNTKYDSRNNCNAIIETATNTLIYGCKNTIIPNSVTSIGTRAFYGCTGLTLIGIPSSVTAIGSDAFNSCGNLSLIICKVSNPIAISKSTFSNYNACLIVPPSSVNNYQTISPWNLFNVSTLSLNQTKIAIPIGATVQLSVTGLAQSINNIISWSSSNTSIASVDSNGLVRGVQAGTALINCDNLSNCIVQVLYPSESAGTGDVNEDGRIDITDATLIVSYLQGNSPVSVLNEALMDVNGDGDINMSDWLIVLSLIRNDN